MPNVRAAFLSRFILLLEAAGRKAPESGSVSTSTSFTASDVDSAPRALMPLICKCLFSNAAATLLLKGKGKSNQKPYIYVYMMVGDLMKTRIRYVTWKTSLLTGVKRARIRFYLRRFKVFSYFKLLHILGLIIIIHSLTACLMHVALRVLGLNVYFCLIFILGDWSTL